MEETMKDYEKELEASFRKIQEGDVIKGTVIGVNEEEVTLDLKYYTQGIIKAADMSGKKQKRGKISVLFVGRRSCADDFKPGNGAYRRIKETVTTYKKKGGRRLFCQRAVRRWRL